MSSYYNMNELNQGFLTGGYASPGGVNKFPGEHTPLCIL